MQKIIKPVGSREESFGNIEIPVFDKIEEAVDSYGAQVILHLLNNKLSQELERTARDNFKKGKDVAEVQAIVDNYRPGQRTTKPTLKNFTALAQEFIEEGDIAALQQAYALLDERVEDAYNFLMEKKIS